MKSNFIFRKDESPQPPTRRINSRFFNFAWLMIALLSLTMWQCKNDDYKETTGICPEVISTVPASNAINVVATAPITVTFNETMNASTISTSTFLVNQGANPVSGVVTPANGEVATFTFTPASPLAPFTVYSGTMKKGVKDPMNNMLQEDYLWSFTTQPLVTLTTNPVLGGIVTGGGLHNVGTPITAIVVPNAGFVFGSWTENGIVVSTDANYAFELAGNRTLVANFIGQYTVTVTSNPLAGGTTTGAGVFNSDASVTLTAVPNVGYTFTNWTEGTTIVSTDANYTFNIATNRIFVANFAPVISQFTVGLSSNPLLGGTTTGVGSFNSGASVTVRAVPAVGFTFTNWTEGTTIVSANANYTFNIAANRIFVANFAPAEANQFQVILSSDPLLGGSTNGEGLYNSGAIVNLTATPNSGFTFTNWTEETTIVSANANYTFTINSNKILVANFESEIILPPSGPALVDLGSAGDFAILAGSGVSNTGVSTMIKGDVGAFPTATMNGLLAGNVNGILYMAADPIVGLAKTALTTAYNDAQSRSINAISLPGQLGGLTLVPGLYENSSTSGISGTGANGILTLDAGGNANAVWIFKVGSTFVTDAGTSIVLAGGAQAKNIFWSVGTSATLGTNSIFYGNILADQAITLTTGATLYGRALTRIAAVTLDTNTVTKP